MAVALSPRTDADWVCERALSRAIKLKIAERLSLPA